MTYRCEKIERPAQPTLAIRIRASVGDLPEVLGRVYDEIAEYLGRNGMQPAGPPFVAYYNMDMQDLDLAIGFPVREELAGEGKIESGEISQGSYATTLHIGPYNTIQAAYEALAAWIEAEELEASDVAYEFYLNDPQNTPPEALQTQILFELE
jgi:effector-binding domain-containing protein